VCVYLEPAFFVYPDEGVNKGERKCPLCEGRVSIQPCSHTLAHTKATCCTNTQTRTHGFCCGGVSSGCSNQHRVGSAKVCEQSLRAEMTSAVNHMVSVYFCGLTSGKNLIEVCLCSFIRTFYGLITERVETCSSCGNQARF